MYQPPRRLDQVFALPHKLVYVVVVAVVRVVDVVQLAVPACPLTIAYPTLGRATQARDGPDGESPNERQPPVGRACYHASEHPDRKSRRW
jgi:hypothetical protein